MRKYVTILAVITIITLLFGSQMQVFAQSTNFHEIEGKRTWNSKTYDLGNGIYSTDIYAGAIHYNDNGWQEIDNEFTPSLAPWDWEMTKAGYNLRVKEDFTAGQVIEFSKSGEAITLQPMALEWTNDLGQIQSISMPKNVTPLVTNPTINLLSTVGLSSHQGTILWENAYGTGIDFEWKATSTRLNKILTVSSLNDIPTPTQYIQNGGNPVLRLNLIFDPSDTVDILVDGELWDKKSKAQTFEVIEFRKDSEILWGFMPLLYWDSSGEDNYGQSIATVEKSGNSLYISVRVPYEWLQSAVYPVFIDVDVDEQVSQVEDDCYRNLTPGYWYLSTQGLYAGAYDASNYEYGSGMRFQTVAIPNGAIIDTAYLTLTCRTAIDGGGAPKTRISAEDVDDAPQFVNNAAAFDARWANRTTARVDWDISGAWVVDTEYNSTDIKTVVKEIVDRPGWATGQDIVLFWEDFEDRSAHDDTDNRPGVYGYDASAAKAAKLHIEYSVGSVPTVITDAADDLEDTTATLNGTVTDADGETIDYYGFVWDTVADAGDPGDVDPSGPPAGWEFGWKSNVGDYGENPFDHGISGLPTGTTIHFRAAAHNVNGWGYGAAASFLTKPAAPTNVAATDGVHENKVVITWTKSTGATDYHVWRDAIDLGAAGDVATFDDNGATAATITNAGTVTASDGTSPLHVTLSLAGEATGTTSHTYKVVASNATGDSDDSLTDTGYRGVGAITYQWQVDDGGGFDNIVGGITDPYNYTSAPAPNIGAGGADASDGTSSLHVTLSAPGATSSNGATYDYQCIVSASGASNSPQTSTNDSGYRGTDALTYEWFRSAADADAAYGTIAGEGGTTNPFNDINGVVDPDGRWYYAIVSMTGATPQSTTHDRGFKAIPGAGGTTWWPIVLPIPILSKEALRRLQDKRRRKAQ